MGNVRRTLATLAAGLAATTGAKAGEQGIPPLSSSNEFYYTRSGDGTQTTGSQFEVGVLYYQESGGRVRAIEPALNASLNLGNDHILTLGFVSDTLTGASPNGAVPSDQPQNFVTPIQAEGSTTTVTTASGGSKIVALPPTPGQVATAALGRQYTVAPGALPLDYGFKDQRYAGTIGWSQPLTDRLKVSVGGGYSSESDFWAASANLGLSQDFNSRNTTVNLAANVEYDKSQPYGGTPTPLSSMTGQWKGPNDSRTVIDVVAGVTQVVNRYWLAQLSYSHGTSRGYNTDPYRIVSVVDRVTGEPVDYIYEGRPRSRTRQSVYLDNKAHLGSNIVDASVRYFWDSWGIRSVTAQVSDRIALTDGLYVEPQVRWYHQSAASFYRYYFVSGDPLPTDISSDTRLGKFTAMTYGLKVGLAVGENDEIDLLGQHYHRQSGNGHPADAFGQLTQHNLFPGVTAVSALLTYTLRF